MSAIAGILGTVGDLLSGTLNRQSQAPNRWAKYSYQLQQAALTHGIRYRVADAKAAGLHPLAALGASVGSPSPVTVSGGYGSNIDLGSGMSQIGQQIDRALAAGKSPVQKQMEQYALLQAEANLKQTQAETVATLSQAHRNLSSTPGVPKPGEPGQPGLPGVNPMDTRQIPKPAPGVEVVPEKRALMNPNDPGSVPGMKQARQYFREGDVIIPAKSETFADSSEEELFENAKRFGRQIKFQGKSMKNAFFQNPQWAAKIAKMRSKLPRDLKRHDEMFLFDPLAGNFVVVPKVAKYKGKLFYFGR